jgi:hypothetical protein
VVAAPRPLNISTRKTVHLLLDCGVGPERIVFGYNLLTNIRMPIAGEHRSVRINGIAGPDTDDDAKVIEQARAAFYEELTTSIRGGRHADRFHEDHVVAFDALSGWNLFGVLDIVLDSLPGDTLVKWRNAAERASRELQQRNQARLRRQHAELAERIARLEKENVRLENMSRGQGDGAADPEPNRIHVTTSATVTQLPDERGTLARQEAEVRAAAERAELERQRIEIANESRRIAERERAMVELAQRQEVHGGRVEEALTRFVVKAVKVSVKVVKSAARKVWRSLFGG